jgi:hypothetical protein
MQKVKLGPGASLCTKTSPKQIKILREDLKPQGNSGRYRHTQIFSEDSN